MRPWRALHLAVSPGARARVAAHPAILLLRHPDRRVAVRTPVNPGPQAQAAVMRRLSVTGMRRGRGVFACLSHDRLARSRSAARSGSHHCTRAADTAAAEVLAEPAGEGHSLAPAGPRRADQVRACATPPPARGGWTCSSTTPRSFLDPRVPEQQASTWTTTHGSAWQTTGHLSVGQPHLVRGAAPHDQHTPEDGELRGPGIVNVSRGAYRGEPSCRRTARHAGAFRCIDGNQP